MEMRQLRYFAQVARSGGFSAASLALDVAQPALSRQVKALEDELGVALFHRTGRGATLTVAGRMLLDSADTVLRETGRISEELRALGGAAAGSAVVGVPPTVGRVLTVGLMHSFRERHAQLDLRVVEGLSGHMADWLRTGKVDVAVLFEDPKVPAVIAEPVVEESLAAVGRPGSAPGDVLRLADLEGRPLILPSRAHTLRRLMEDAAARAGLRLTIGYEIDSLHSMLEAARLGLGLTIVPPASVRADLARGDLAAWPIVEPEVIRVLHIGTAAQRGDGVALGRLAAMVREQMLRVAEGGAWRPVAS